MSGEMVWVPPGEFSMGSEGFYPEEGPVRRLQVPGLWIDKHPVTNKEFATFVEGTGYVSTAERPLDSVEFDEVADRSPGSMVFTQTEGPVDLGNWRAWWTWVPGACWHHPRGPGSTIRDLDDHPVVQVSFDDAAAYAAWAGKALPTEAEWEHAARGGLDGAVYAWGDDPHPDAQLMANTWQGKFPYENSGAMGWVGTSPVGTFPPNGYGLWDMTGNVWEWTIDLWTADHRPQSACCPPDHRGDGQERQTRVLKGGSHLCSPQYCLRYRPAARSPESVDSSTTHIGFRCVRRDESEGESAAG